MVTSTVTSSPGDHSLASSERLNGRERETLREEEEDEEKEEGQGVDRLVRWLGSNRPRRSEKQ